MLPLLVPCANNKHAVGQNREKWFVNPGANSPTHMQMFAFLGKLMGIAIRTKARALVLLLCCTLVPSLHTTGRLLSLLRLQDSIGLNLSS